MKTVLLAIIVLFSIQVNAQVWVEDNAIWHYDYSDPTGGSGGYRIVEHYMDTVINGQPCKAFTVSNMSFVVDQYGDIQFFGNFGVGFEYTYVQGDSVLRWDGNEFRLMFDFGAQVNDSWIVDVSSAFIPACSDTSVVTVVDAGVENIMGIDYRYVDLQSPIEAFRPLNGRFYERFGSVTGYTFPYYQECDQQGLLDLLLIHELRCFQDDSISLNFVGEDCEYLMTHLGTDEVKLSADVLFPNPTNNIVHVQRGNRSYRSIQPCWQEGS